MCYVKIMFLPCGFSSNRRCSSLTLQPCLWSRSDHGLTAVLSTSPGSSQPRGERNQATAPGVQGCGQSVPSAQPPAPRGCSQLDGKAGQPSQWILSCAVGDASTRVLSTGSASGPSLCGVVHALIYTPQPQCCHPGSTWASRWGLSAEVGIPCAVKLLM